MADVILGGFWTATILEERESISLRYQFETLEAPRTETRFYDCRHDSLACLALLIEGWPDSRGASIGREMLWRGLYGFALALAFLTLVSVSDMCTPFAYTRNP